MAKNVGSTRSARSELASKEFPPVRLFRVQTVAAKEPQPEVTGSWTIPDRTSVGDFPALAYLFAKELHAKTHVPVGIVEVTDASPVSIQRGGKVTGSTVEAWISEATLRRLRRRSRSLTSTSLRPSCARRSRNTRTRWAIGN